jgi:hypothetical protein
MFLQSTSTDNFVQINLAGLAHLIIMNDNALNSIAFSYSGNSLDGVILPNEGFEFDDDNQPVVYIKSNVAGSPAAYRVFSFGDPSIIYLPQQQPSFNANSNRPNSMNVSESGIFIPQKKGVH